MMQYKSYNVKLVALMNIDYNFRSNIRIILNDNDKRHMIYININILNIIIYKVISVCNIKVYLQNVLDMSIKISLTCDTKYILIHFEITRSCFSKCFIHWMTLNQLNHTNQGFSSDFWLMSLKKSSGCCHLWNLDRGDIWFAACGMCDGNPAKHIANIAVGYV